MMRAILATILLLLVSANWGAPALAQGEPALGIHLGVATCSGSSCHGAAERPRNSAVPGNEYLIWSTKDKHRNAYNVLLQDRALRMAHALGLPDAANQKMCLDCHADNVPANLRGRQFQIADGVQCETCHGGASRWLGSHISGASHAQNIAAGLYPTNQPVARAEKCLNCHLGDSAHYIDHRIYGAGHPRLAFELDTFTAIEPAHFVVDASYIQRKGKVTDIQVWATGQAVTLVRRMDEVLDPKYAPKGMWPEFSMFDCQSCHHEYGTFERPTATGLGPGTVKFYDANEVMLKVAASRVAPGAANALSAHMMALHRATQSDWGAVQREAVGVRQAAQSLVTEFSRHDFTGDDMRAMANALIALGAADNDSEFSHDEQITMALEALTTGLKASGDIEGQQGETIGNAMSAVYTAFTSDKAVRHEDFVKALKELQRTMRR
ncbi:MAG TPA: multiheme c-type cytochrome [Stellaceae bacterium]|nr:multiheme c-type cytochrome [Stellaceae bacterium]